MTTTTTTPATYVVDGYPIGPVEGDAGTLPAHPDTGWSREGAWYGSSIGGDDADSLAFETRYASGSTRCDVSYYVHRWSDDDDGTPDYGVTECSHTFYVDENDENTGDSREAYQYETLIPSFTTRADAMAHARGWAVADLRWMFVPVKDEPNDSGATAGDVAS